MKSESMNDDMAPLSIRTRVGIEEKADDRTEAGNVRQTRGAGAETEVFV